MFPYGQDGTDVHDLANVLLDDTDDIIISTTEICSECNISKILFKYKIKHTIHLTASSNLYASIQEYFTKREKQSLLNKCTHCKSIMTIQVEYSQFPDILFICLRDNNIHINKSIKLTASNHTTRYYIRGIIYYGTFHFNCLTFNKDKYGWFHDGITTGSKSKKVTHISLLANLCIKIKKHVLLFILKNLIIFNFIRSSDCHVEQ